MLQTLRRAWRRREEEEEAYEQVQDIKGDRDQPPNFHLNQFLRFIRIDFTGKCLPLLGGRETKGRRV